MNYLHLYKVKPFLINEGNSKAQDKDPYNKNGSLATYYYNLNLYSKQNDKINKESFNFSIRDYACDSDDALFIHNKNNIYLNDDNMCSMFGEDSFYPNTRIQNEIFLKHERMYKALEKIMDLNILIVIDGSDEFILRFPPIAEVIEVFSKSLYFERASNGDKIYVSKTTGENGRILDLKTTLSRYIRIVEGEVNNYEIFSFDIIFNLEELNELYTSDPVRLTLTLDNISSIINELYFNLSIYYKDQLLVKMSGDNKLQVLGKICQRNPNKLENQPLKPLNFYGKETNDNRLEFFGDEFSNKKHAFTIDEPLFPIIKKLIENGLYTSYCCSGHSYSDCYMYIKFRNYIWEEIKEKAEILLMNCPYFEIDDCGIYLNKNIGRLFLLEMEGSAILRSESYDYNNCMSYERWRQVLIDQLDKVFIIPIIKYFKDREANSIL